MLISYNFEKKLLNTATNDFALLASMLGVEVCGNADDDPSVLIGHIALCSMAVALKRKIVIVIIPCYGVSCIFVMCAI